MNFQIAAFPQSFYIPADCGVSPGLVPQGRMQQVGSRAYLPMQLLNGFLNPFGVAAELWRLTGGLLSRLRASIWWGTPSEITREQKPWSFSMSARALSSGEPRSAAARPNMLAAAWLRRAILQSRPTRITGRATASSRQTSFAGGPKLTVSLDTAGGSESSSFLAMVGSLSGYQDDVMRSLYIFELQAHQCLIAR
jgi:hypothetical protein